MKIISSIALAVTAFALLLAADARRGKQAPVPVNAVEAKTQQQAVQKPAVNENVATDPTAQPAAMSPAAFNLNWYSINGGGTTNSSSGSYQMGLSVGQSAAGFAAGGPYELGIGFWYGAAAGGGACPVAITGDVNSTTTITSADIIYLVNYVFKGGATPLPCAAAGDVNCNGTITSADVIYLVNFVFKGGAAPCDVCTIIPALWSCP
jgi:hypothetical protein